MVFHLPCEADQVKKLFPIQRQASKAITFGILYGSGPSKVAESVNKEGGSMTVSEAEEVIQQYFDTFKQLKKWIDATKSKIEQDGFIYTSVGRKRRLKNVFSSDRGIASHEVRSGLNATIQATASDINLLALINAQKELEKRKLDANIFMLVHDSIVALVKDECVEEYKQILKTCTQHDYGFSISGYPIGVDQDVGQDYSFGSFDEKFGEEYARFIETKVADLPAS